MEFVFGFIVFYIFMILLVTGLCAIQYVLNAFGLYTMAKRRGIRNPWLAWVPVGSSWILGCISDQYQYVTKGLRRSRRKLLLGLSVVGMILPGLFFVFMIVMILLVEVVGEWLALVMLLGYFGGLFLMMAVSIWSCILMYMSLYDLYQSADPDKAVLYLLLSIFVGTIAQAVVVFLCRDKDDGMPPRSATEPVTMPLGPANHPL